MKCIKDIKVQDTFISTSIVDNSSTQVYTSCGRRNGHELKILYKVDITTIRELLLKKNEIKKVELCLFFLEFKHNCNTSEFKISINRNLNEFNIKDVTYLNAPKVISAKIGM